MKNTERTELFVSRYMEYATSGDYADSTFVEIALRSEFPDMRLSAFQKQRIDEICRQAQGKTP